MVREHATAAQRAASDAAEARAAAAAAEARADAAEQAATATPTRDKGVGSTDG